MRVLIGVAWPYASGPRHLGHLAGAYLPADIVARYHRLAGDEVLMVSGSDQHGTPITVAAERAGRPPAEFADAQHALISKTFERIGVSFDHYTKTATPRHAATAQWLFTRLHDNGHISEGLEKGAWCPRERRSIPDRYVEGTCPHCSAPDARGDQCDTCGRTLDPDELLSPRCRRCGASAEVRPLRQLFLRLDALQPDLEAYVASRAPGWRRFVGNETRGWLAEGLRARAVTRDLPWGVKVPLAGWDERRLYVWFDAVIGYLSASIEWAERVGEPDAWRAWWQDDAAWHRYFVGKDNIPFHTLWWPAILIGAREELHAPDDVVASHYLTQGADKMSASRGRGFAIDEAIDRVGVDPLRHGLCALSPETDDVEFTWEAADDLTRSGLLGDIANPAYRVATLLWRRFGGEPDLDAWATVAAPDRRVAAESLVAIGDDLRRANLRSALARIHALGRTVNRRLAVTEPWHLDDDAARRELTCLLPYLDALAVAAAPVVPETARRLRSLLGRAPEPSAWDLDDEPPRMRHRPRPPLELSPSTRERSRADRIA